MLHYHDAVAGSRGEVDVVGVGRDPAISLLDVVRYILPDALDPLAGAVGPLNAPEGTLIGADDSASIGWRAVCADQTHFVTQVCELGFGGVRCLTYAAAATCLQEAPRSVFGIFRESVVL